MNKKIIWGIIILIVVIGGVYCFSINKNKVIDTANWKTYKDENYGFQINYPSDGKEFNVNVENGKNFYFSFESNRNKALDILVSNQANCADVGAGDNTNKVKIGDIEFIKYDVSKVSSKGEDTFVAKVYCVVKNEKTYKIVPKIAYRGAMPNIDNDNFLNLIISTFKFN